jgi:rSAM/selenodomain-associated transferase 2
MSLPYSIIIPTLNEADNIADALASARASFGDSAECIVVDAGSTDATLLISDRAGARVFAAAGGRGAQMAAGAATAKGNVLLFLHADTRLPRNAREKMDAALKDSAVAGGAFRVRFREEDLPITMRMLAASINARSLLFRSATGDQAIFARAAILKSVGGVPLVPLFEDVLLYRALRRAGRVVLLDAIVETSARLWLRHGPLRVMLMHLSFRAMHKAGASPQTLARWYAKAAK